MKLTQLLLTALLSALVAPVFAQSASTHGIDAAQHRQERRIEHGVRSGQLTAHEARHLQHRENKIEAHKRLAKADGVVTRHERAQLRHELHRTSRMTHHRKHNLHVS